MLPPLRLPRWVVLSMLWPTMPVVLHHRSPWAWQRTMCDLGGMLLPLPRGTVNDPIELAGLPAERITCGDNSAGAVLYLHGGGYTTGSILSHRSGAAFLARSAHVTVYLLEHRLAPEHPHPAAVEDGIAAYLELLHGHGYSPGSLALAGDSSGGGQALAVTRRLLDDHRIRPAALALIAPWTDMADQEPPDGRLRDVVGTAAWGLRCRDAVLAGGDPYDPQLSPMHADLTGFPPVVVEVGGTDLMCPQVRRLVDRLRAARVPVDYTEYPGLWHVFHLLAGVLAPAADAMSDLGARLRARLGSAAAAEAFPA